MGSHVLIPGIPGGQSVSAGMISNPEIGSCGAHESCKIAEYQFEAGRNGLRETDRLSCSTQDLVRQSQAVLDTWLHEPYAARAT